MRSTSEGAIGRSTWDAPEIDGNVYLNGETGLRPGDRARVTVEASDEYDLWGSARRASRRANARARPRLSAGRQPFVNSRA